MIKRAHGDDIVDVEQIIHMMWSDVSKSDIITLLKDTNSAIFLYG